MKTIGLVSRLPIPNVNRDKDCNFSFNIRLIWSGEFDRQVTFTGGLYKMEKLAR